MSELSTHPPTVYQRRHKAVVRARGRADKYNCCGCAKRADDWATVHTESGIDPWSDYIALCTSCHLRYDSRTLIKCLIAAKLRVQGNTYRQIAHYLGYCNAKSAQRKVRIGQEYFA